MKMNFKKNMKATVLAAVAALSIGAFGIVSATNISAVDQNKANTTQMNGNYPSMPGQGHKNPGQHMQQRLATLVENGSITQAQADSIKTANDKLRSEEKADFEQKRTNRDQERQSLATKTGISEDTLKELFQRPERPNMQNNQQDVVNDQKVQDGQMAQNSQQNRPQFKRGDFMKAGQKNPMQERLAMFVKNGKITQAQSDALTKEFEAKRAEHKAEHDAYKAKLAKEAGVSQEVIEKVFARPELPEGQPPIGENGQPPMAPNEEQGTANK